MSTRISESRVDASFVRLSPVTSPICRALQPPLCDLNSLMASFISNQISLVSGECATR
ncbi:unnamed protein product, partial [Nesidiocoris tenuis]